MKIAILDDYQDAVRSLECFSLLNGHDELAHEALGALRQYGPR
jgi:hypothetical protein